MTKQIEEISARAWWIADEFGAPKDSPETKAAHVQAIIELVNQAAPSSQQREPQEAGKAEPRMSLIRSLVQEKNKLNKALELACNYLTEEQAAEIAAAMPDDSKEASKAVPVADGWKLVPIKPTEDMLFKMAEVDGHLRGDRDHPMLTQWEDYWNMALDASPAPPASQQPEPQEAAEVSDVVVSRLKAALDSDHPREEIDLDDVIRCVLALARKPASPQEAAEPTDEQWRASKYGQEAAKLADDYQALLTAHAALLETVTPSISAPQEAGKAVVPSGFCDEMINDGTVDRLGMEYEEAGKAETLLGYTLSDVHEAYSRGKADASKEAGKAETYTEFLKREFGEGMGQDRVSFSIGNVSRAFGAGVESGKKEAGKVEAVADERMRHIANEWADMATNGLQWLRNIRDGISKVEDAVANMEGNMEHCRQVNDAPSQPEPPLYLRPSQQALGEVPDMFWDHDDGERYGNDIDEIVSDYGPGEIVKIDCAKRLPSIKVRVIVDPSDPERLTYEELPAILAAAGGSEK